MARYARLLTAIWRDRDFRNLSHGAQWLYFVLLSQPTRSLVGVLPYQPHKWERLSADLKGDELGDILAELDRRRYVVVDHHSEELLIRSFVRHDRAYGTAVKGLWLAFDAVESDELRRQIVRELPAEAWNNPKFSPSPAARLLLVEERPA